MKITVHLDAAALRRGLKKLPRVMRRHIGAAVAQSAAEIAVEAKDRAPKSLSNLVNSIVAAREDDWAWVVRPGVQYAAHVEYGTGPAAGKAKYYPNPDNLLQYLMTSPKARGFSRFKRSERGRLEQEMALARRAQAFAWWIYQRGTKAQPFMGPAVEAKRDACVGYIRAAVDTGLREIFGS
jgi:HK97 gp10 family phage protein